KPPKSIRVFVEVTDVINSNSITRREVLSRLGGGFGGLVLSVLSGKPVWADPHGAPSTIHYDLRAKQPHFAPKAKAVIQLFMHGGPSHVDLLDPKPMLAKYDGKAPPAEVADDEKLTGNLLKSPYRFEKHGQSGIELSETLPHLARHIDDVAVIRSMFTLH